MARKERGVVVQGSNSSGTGQWPPKVRENGERERDSARREQKERAAVGGEREERKYVGLKLQFWDEDKKKKSKLLNFYNS